METPFVSVNSDRGAASLAVSLTASQAERMADSVLFLDREERDRRERRHQKRWTAAVASVSVASMVVALAAMIVETSVFAYAAFLIPFLTGPCVIHQRRKLHRLPRLTAVVNDCRQEINDVMVLNGRLRAENARLKGQVARLAEAEAKLGQVAAQSNTNVDRVRELVRENGETQRQMKKLQNARELQKVLQAVLASDRNQDAELTAAELEQLMLRLSTFSVADAAKLHTAMKMASTTSATSIYKQYAAATDGTYEDYVLSGWLFEEGDIDEPTSSDIYY